MIATALTEEEKHHIVRTLDSASTRSIHELAIQAGQNQVAAEVPKVYERFAKLFSNEASSRFPPSRPWDHAIDFKPTPQTHSPVRFTR
jgi:hypothetical protein